MNVILKGLLTASIVSLSAFASNAQIVVKIRPHRPTHVVVRPVAPSPRHVWIDEDWVQEGDHYRWAGGRWEAPPRPHAVWTKGYWKHSRRGDIWVSGRWR